MLSNRELKNARYSGFAEIAKIFSNAKRLEIIDLLIQRPRSVEEIATAIEQSVASTSQHLQVLKRSKSVQTQRQGTTIIYSLVDGTLDVFVALRRLAEAISPDLQLIAQQRRIFPVVHFDEVIASKEDSKTVLLDVRTEAEFAVAHIDGAINIPLSSLPQRYTELDSYSHVIVTCRGPYCVSSGEAARFLTEQNVDVRVYDDGVGEWIVQGGEVSST